MPKKVAVGVVISDKMQKTRRVEIPRLVKHPVYGKYIRQRTIYHVHDEEEASAMGDTVEIIEAQPRSKLNRWDLIRVVKKNSETDLAALRAAQDVAEAEQEVIGAPDTRASEPTAEAESTQEDPALQAEPSSEAAEESPSEKEETQTTDDDQGEAEAK